MTFYDRIIANPIYIRLMWGNSISELDKVIRTALSSFASVWYGMLAAVHWVPLRGRMQVSLTCQ